MFTKKEKTIIGLLFFIHFVMIIDFMIIMPMAPHLMNLFSISAQQLSLLITTFTLAAGFIGLISSKILDRFDRKQTLFIAVLGFIAGNVGCALATGFWAFTIARGVTGSFVGIIGSLMLAIISDAIPLEKRGKAIGLVMSALALASIVGVPFCLFLYQKLNWSAPFWFLTICSFIFLISMAFFMPNFKGHLKSSQKIRLLQTREQKISVFFIIFLILGHFTINPFLFVSLIQNAKIPESQLTPLYLCAGLGSILSSILSGYWVDKFGFKKVFKASLLLSLLSLFWVTNFTAPNLIFATASVTTFFIFMGARMTAAMTWVTSHAQLENRGSFMSLINSFQHLSAAIAALIAGQIVQKTPTGEILHFEYVGYVAIVFSLVALYIPSRIEKKAVP